MKFYVLHEQRLVVGYSPKCGSTGLAHWIVGGLLGREDVVGRRRLSAPRDFLRRNDFACHRSEAAELVCSDHYKLVAFVRHPYSRVASVYLDKFVFRRGVPLAWPGGFEIFAEKFMRDAYRFSGRDIADYAGLSFAEFLTYVSHCKSAGIVMDDHWAPQVSGLKEKLKRVLLDRRCMFVRHESFDADLQHCNMVLGCSYVLPKINENKTPEGWDTAMSVLDYSAMTNTQMIERAVACDKEWLLDERMRLMISDIYSEDFSLLDYEQDVA